MLMKLQMKFAQTTRRYKTNLSYINTFRSYMFLIFIYIIYNLLNGKKMKFNLNPQIYR